MVFSNSFDGYRNLYLFSEEDASFEFLEKNRIQPRYPNYFVGYYYVEDNFKRYSVRRNSEGTHPFAYENGGEFRIIDLPFQPHGTGYELQNNRVYLGRDSDNAHLNEAANIQVLDLESGELTTLPIKGVDPKVVGDYLFYANYPDPEQFDLVYDHYRVKIGEWDNPVKIFEDNYMNGWKVSGDGGNLLVEIIETGYKPQKVIYNLDVKRYSPIPGEDDLPSATFYSRKKKAFCFYDVGLVSNGSRRFQYIPIPDSFPYTPSWAMDFGNSFITHYLLEEASEEELLQFDKSELRLLRNSIFARKGWRFRSEDLQTFFGQFDWYKDQLKRVDSNDEVILTNTDKYRSQLILRIEEKK